MFVGVNGCPRGWFAVAFPKLGEPAFGVFQHVEELWRKYHDAELICIDIPIGLRRAEGLGDAPASPGLRRGEGLGDALASPGLREGGLRRGEDDERERACDLRARELLGDRASSVFPAPCREAAYAPTYKKACDINERLTGKRISKQTWAIVPRIRELDELLRRDERARACFREVHPELCFWAFAGGRPMTHHKSTEQGYLERANLLEHVHPRAYDIIAEALDAFPRSAVARDDILDALAAAVTALAGPNALATLPKNPGTDPESLPMQMVYSPQFLEYEWP